MVFLLLAIIATVFLGICFKVWPRVGIRVLPGIMHNYLACVVTAGLVQGELPTFTVIREASWLSFAIGLSLLFLVGFYLFAQAIWYWGIATMSAVQKMSLLISAGFAFIMFGEPLLPIRVAGIVLGVLAIVLLLTGTRERTRILPGGQWWGWILVAGTFILSGTIEIGLMVVERMVASTSGDPVFIGTLFLLAHIWGWIPLLWSPEDRRSFFSWRHVLAGWLLGVPNFFSIYWVMRAIGSDLPSSIIFPAVNTGTILLSVLIGIGFFRERLNKANLVGVGIAVLALLLLTLS